MADGVICDIPFDSEYDLAEAVLASWGFQFEVIDSNEMTVSKDDCRRQASSKYTEEELRIRANPEKPKGMVSVLDLPEETSLILYFYLFKPFLHGFAKRLVAV